MNLAQSTLDTSNLDVYSEIIKGWLFQFNSSKEKSYDVRKCSKSVCRDDGFSFGPTHRIRSQ
ncbi:hypothetical protein VspSTUT11_42460 [Vibrio sp. STUT-A11]|nr:hypothetical protein VspSTUT11_42460 [Vibrio sp. STUT-A11]